MIFTRELARESYRCPACGFKNVIGRGKTT